MPPADTAPAPATIALVSRTYFLKDEAAADGVKQLLQEAIARLMDA